MEILTADQTRERLPYAALADAILAVMRAGDAGQASAPERSRVALPEDGTLLLMPATDERIAMTKMVTVHPHNAAHDLPTIQGELIVFEARTGRRIGLLDGATVSARRTAALSLLAARELAPVRTGPVAIVGAGTQARAHLEAFHEGLGCERFFICSRTRARARALADHAAGLGMQAEVIERIEDAPDDTRLFAATTTARSPVLPEHLPADAFVAAVGAFKPDMAELPPALIGGARVVVDTLDGARAEAGDLIHAVEAGAFDWHNARTLARAIDESAEASAGPVLFKSVGHSLWDLAAARLAFANN